MIAAPSFYALGITGLILLFVFIYSIRYCSQIQSHFLIIMILIGILIGVHGLLHLGLEKVYGFNPLKSLSMEMAQMKAAGIPFSK